MCQNIIFYFISAKIHNRKTVSTYAKNWQFYLLRWLQFSSVAQSCPTLCDPMDCSMPGFPVHQQFPEPTQTQVHGVQPSHPLLSPSPPAFSLSQHQGLFQWVCSLHQVAKVLEFIFIISLFNVYSGLISFRMASTNRKWTWKDFFYEQQCSVFESTSRRQDLNMVPMISNLCCIILHALSSWVLAEIVNMGDSTPVILLT